MDRGQSVISQVGQTASGRHRGRTVGRLARPLAPVGLATLLLGVVFLTLAVSAGAAGITVSKSSSAGTVAAGDSYTYTIVVSNTTGTDIFVTITDVVPSNVAVIDLGGGSLSNGVVQWSRGPVNNGTATQVSFTVVATRAGAIVNAQYQATSGANYGVGAPVTTTVNAGSPAQVSLTAAPNPATVGSSSVITVSVIDAYGNPVAEGSTVAIEYDHGTIDGRPSGSVITGVISGGYLTKSLVVGTVTGASHVTATAGGMTNTLTVVIQPDAPATLDVQVAPTLIQANGTSTAAITATVSDRYNNRVTSLPVTITTSLGRLNGIGPAVTSPTNSQGQATATLSGTVAGTATLYVTAGALTDGTRSVYLAPGPPARLTLVAAPDVITADGTSSSTITLQILDTFDNRVDTPVPVTLTTSLGTFGGGGSTYHATPSNGQAQTTLRAGTLAGTARISAQAAGLTTSVAIDVAPGPPYDVILVARPVSIPADGASTATLTATVRDQYANAVRTSTTVTLTAAAGTLLPDAAGTTTNGVLTRSLRSTTTLGTVPITATAGGVTNPATGTVEFTVGQPIQAQIVVVPTPPISAGQVATLTVTVRDSVGHLVPGASITMATTRGVILPSPTGATDGSGVLTRTLYVTLAGTANLSAIGPGGPLSVSGDSVQVAPDVAAQAVSVVSPTSLVADDLATAVVTTTITDRFGNPVAGHTPAFTVTLGTLTGDSATDSVGVVTRTFRAGLVLGTASVSATGLTTVTPAMVQLVAGSAAAAQLTAAPATAYVYNVGSAYKPDVITLTVRVTDHWDHPIIGQTMTVTSTLGILSGSGATDALGVLTRVLTSTQSGQPQIYVDGILASGDSVTILPGPLQRITVLPTGSVSMPVQLAAGVPFTFTAVAQDTYNNALSGYTFAWAVSTWDGGQGQVAPDTGVFLGTRVGMVMVRATASGRTGLSYVQVTPGLAAQAVITATPTTLPADGASTSSMQVQVMDAYGNRVGAGVPITVTSSIGTLEGSAPTDQNGLVLRTLRSFLAGRALIGVTGMQTVTGNTVITFAAGLPARASVQAVPTSVPANGVATSTLRITLLDAYNNPVSAGYAATVQTSLGSLTGSGVTDANGVFTRTLIAPTTAGEAGFTIRYQGSVLPRADGGVTVLFVVGDMDHLDTTPDGPLTVVAGQPAVLAAQGYDIDEAPIPAASVSYGWEMVRYGDGNGVLQPRLGAATVFTGTSAGDSVFLTAWAIWSDQYFDKWLEVTVLPGPPAAAHAVASATVITADGVSPITLTLSNIVDQFGNTVADGTRITVTLQSAPPPRSGNGVVSSGQTELVLTATTRSGTFPITAAHATGSIALSGVTELTFLPGPAAQATVTAVTPTQIYADGVSTCTFVLRLYDAFGNPVAAGVSPVITASMDATLLPGGAATDVNGVLTRTLRAGLDVGQPAIYVNGFAASGINPTLIPGAPASAGVSASSTTLRAGGQTTSLVFTVRDIWNHPVADGTVITPTLTPPHLAGLSGNRFAVGGLVTQTLTSGSGVGTIMVSATGITVTGDTLITVVPSTPAIALVRATPAVLSVGGTTTLVVTVTDIYSNVVPPSTITVTSQLGAFEGGSGTIARQTAGGALTTTLSSTTAGTDTLTFVGDAGALSLHPASDGIRFTPGSPQQIVLEPTGPLNLAAGTPVTLTVTGRDIYGNAVDPWAPIDYAWRQSSPPGGAGRGTLTALVPHSQSVRFLPQRVGDNQVWATGAAFTSNVLAVTVVNGPAALATVAVEPDSVPADGVSTFVISVTQVTDAYGNAMPDGTPLTITVACDPPLAAHGVTQNGVLTRTLTAGLDAGTHPVTVLGATGPLTLSGETGIEFAPGTPINAAITALPVTLPADGISTSVVTVTVSDGQYNHVRDGIPITVTASMGTLTGVGATKNGVVTRTLRAPVAVGVATFNVEARNGGLIVTGDTVEFVPGPAAQAWVDAEPAALVADGSSTAQVAILVKDANGFIVRGVAPVQLAVLRGTIVPTGTVATDGIVTATFTAGGAVGPVGLSVTYAGVPVPTYGDRLQLTGGPATSAVVLANPTSLTVGSASPVSLEISLLDSLGRAVADGTVVTLTTSLGSVASNASTTLNGVVTRQLIAGTVAGTATFTVTTPYIELRPSGDTVRFLAGLLNSIGVSPAGPLTMTACTSRAFQATGYDAYYNVLSTGGYTWRLDPRTGDGILSANGAFTATRSGAVGLDATQGFVRSPVVNVTIVPGAAFTAVVRANPTTIPTGGSTSQLTITAWDACGNLVADGTALNIIATAGTVSGSSTTRGGVLTRTLISPDDIYADPAAFYVNGWLAAGDRVPFIPGVSAASLSAEPGQLYADGASQSLLRITMWDAAGLPVPDGTLPVITTSLGTLSGSGSSVGGIVTRTLKAPLTPGTARIYVAGAQVGSVPVSLGEPSVAFIKAQPPYVMADGSSSVQLTITVQDDYGHTMATSQPLQVSTSLGVLDGASPTVNGVTTRRLTSSVDPGAAHISVAGLVASGDTTIHFVGTGTLGGGGFDTSSLSDWGVGRVITPPGAAPAYTTTVVSRANVGGIAVSPRSGPRMVQLGASTPNNSAHQISYAWLRQPMLVPITGTTRVTFWYRLLSFDVAIGSPARGSLEWDPFEVYANGREVLQDGLRFSDEWYAWYQTHPQTPKDLGWKQGVLDVTPYAGQVLMLEFRVSNLQAPVDNTWVFLDDVAVEYTPPETVHRLFLPVVDKNDD